MQFFKPENYFEVREALIQVGRQDLIGGGCDCLIPAQPPKQAIDARRRQANSGGHDHYHTVANPAQGGTPSERRAGPVKLMGYRPGRKSAGRRQWQGKGRTAGVIMGASLQSHGEEIQVVANFTPTQGRYLAFIHAYIGRHGYPPAESEIAAAMCVSPPSVNQMVKTLEKKGLILRHPGQPRSLQILVPEDEISPWNQRKSAKNPDQPGHSPRRVAATPAAPPATLYVVSVFLTAGPVSEKFANKAMRRDIEIRGDQTLEKLHQAIFEAFDRSEEQLYEFQFGKRPFDPAGPNYGVASPQERKKGDGDARATTLDDLDLKLHRVFGYRFDFGAEWFHQVQVERVEQAIPTVTYPRVIKRVGKSPPQYAEE